VTVTPINNHDHPEPSVANATGISEEAAEPAPTRGRARVREDDQMPLANATPTEAEGRGLLGWLGDQFERPEIWSKQRPSLEDIWNYARYGPWTDQARTTPARVAGLAYAAVVVVTHGAGYLLLWVTERPGRFAVVAGLAGLIGLSWLI
jgi:hypothetical protein